MIIDRITNISKYKSLIPHIEIVAEYLKSIDLNQMDPGKYHIPNTDLFHYCFIYETLPFALCKGEAHQQYLDIHIIVKGRETVGALDGTSDQIGPYDAKTDHSFATGSFRRCTLSQGDFVVFFQHEGHITSAHAEADISEEVKRLVFKIPMNLA